MNAQMAFLDQMGSQSFEQGAYEARSAPCEGLQGMLMEHARKAFAGITD